jgi:hypothetical protein
MRHPAGAVGLEIPRFDDWVCWHKKMKNESMPRLRSDKVATRVVERLQAALAEAVPDGMTVLVTITAPIRVPAKTAAILEDEIRALLKRKSLRRDVIDTIHGNRVRIRLLKDQSARVPKLIGFVHNPDTDPRLLLEMGGKVSRAASLSSGRPPSRAALRRASP